MRGRSRSDVLEENSAEMFSAISLVELLQRSSSNERKFIKIELKNNISDSIQVTILNAQV